ncbi:MAG TPA: MFS transporter [Chloroflexota bacterium]|nr:MFS transporter [Chloroflexota bacterium]
MLAALRRRDFALLWLGGLVSSIGDLILYVALPFYVYILSGSALATGTMFLAETLPRLLLGSLAGVFVDRWDRRRTMLVADLARVALVLLLLLLHSRGTLWVVYVVAALESAVGQFFGPAQNALLPRLVGDELLVPANALNALSMAVTQLVGPSLGGALFALLGLRGVVLADSFSFLFSAAMLALIVVPSAAPTVVEVAADGMALVAGIARGWLEGLRLVRRERTLTALFVALGLGAVGQGIINVIVVIFVRQVLHGSALTFGWLITAQGVGGILGGLLVGQVSRRLSPATLLLIGGLAAGGTLVVIALFPSVLLTLVLIAPAGVTIVGYSVSASTLLQRGTADAFRGRVFGALGTTNALMMLAGIGAASVLGDRLGAAVLLAVAGLLYAAAGLAALALPVYSGASAVELPAP